MEGVTQQVENFFRIAIYGKKDWGPRIKHTKILKEDLSAFELRISMRVISYSESHRGESQS